METPSILVCHLGLFDPAKGSVRSLWRLRCLSLHPLYYPPLLITRNAGQRFNSMSDGEGQETRELGAVLGSPAAPRILWCLAQRKRGGTCHTPPPRLSLDIGLSRKISRDSRSALLSPLSRQLGVQYVPEGVPDQIPAQHEQQDRHSWIHDDVPVVE